MKRVTEKLSERRDTSYKVSLFSIYIRQPQSPSVLSVRYFCFPSYFPGCSIASIIYRFHRFHSIASIIPSFLILESLLIPEEATGCSVVSPDLSSSNLPIRAWWAGPGNKRCEVGQPGRCVRVKMSGSAEADAGHVGCLGRGVVCNTAGLLDLLLCLSFCSRSFLLQCPLIWVYHNVQLLPRIWD